MSTITAQPSTAGLSTLAKWGIGLSLGALLLPLIGLVAFIIGVVLLIRSEIGPGLGVMALSSICGMLGFFIALAIGIGVA
jgi:hypothetical protein